MARIKLIQELVQDGVYYLTEHADEEAQIDGFDVFDVEHGFLTGRIRRLGSREGKYEVVGRATDNRAIGIVCRITPGNRVRVITVYEDEP